jgi:predicted MFS family arabinose efflux permease
MVTEPGGMGAPRSRWPVLAAYGLVAASTQMLWLTYAPITTATAQRYGVSEGAVGWLANIFPFVYVVLAVPTGRALDHWFRPSLAAGAVLTAAGGVVRLTPGGGFGAAFAGQLLVAVAQPLVLSAVTTVSAAYLARRHRPTGIALGSASLFAGMILAFVFGAAFGGARLHGLLVVQAAFAVVAAAALLAGLRRSGEHAPARVAAPTALGPAALGPAALGPAASTTVGAPASVSTLAEPPPGGSVAGGSARRLWREPYVRTVVVLVSLGFGVFVAVTTWLQSLLKPSGVSDGTTGGLLVAMVVAGMVGAAVLPPWAARRGCELMVVRASIVVTALSCAALALAPGAAVAGIGLSATGFLLLADLPILLEMAERRAGPEGGTVTALIWLGGNAGGLAVALAVQGLLSHPALAFGLLVLVVTAALTVARDGVFTAAGLGGAATQETGEASTSGEGVAHVAAATPVR